MLEEEKYKVEFTAKPEFMTILKRAQEIAFDGSAGSSALETVIGDALKLYLEKHCPIERLKRRELRAGKRTVSQSLIVQNSDSRVSQKDDARKGVSRHIPVALRDQIMARDDYRCTFRGSGGGLCGCTTGLEIDHIVPFARGGRTELSNLRVLCGSHNMQAEIQSYGRDFVNGKLLNSREKTLQRVNV